MVNGYLIKQLLDSVCVVPLKHRLRQIVQTSVLDTHTQLHPVIVKYWHAHNKSIFTNDEIKFKSWMGVTSYTVS